MKTVLVNDYDCAVNADFILDLRKQKIQHCLGCWNCWLKTPGQCVRQDMNAFYHAFVNADEVLFCLQIHHDFISGNAKSLFDRLLVMALPYIGYEENVSRHAARYEKLPKLKFLYRPDFSTDESEQAFHTMLKTIAFQLHTFCVIEADREGTK